MANWGGGASGALSGASTGATIGSVVPGIGTGVGAGVGALAGFLGGLFGGKDKTKHDKEGLAEQDAAARRAWDQNEQMRIARLKSLMSTASARGINVGTLDPSLLVPRPYPGPDSTKGVAGPGFWTELLKFGGNTALGAAQSGAFDGMGGAEMAGPPGSMISSGVNLDDPIVAGLLEAQRQKSMLGGNANDGGGGYQGPFI